MKKKNLIGLKYNKLLIIEELENRSNNKKIMYKCFCDCGNYIDVIGASLISGNTTSCGCNAILSKKECRKIDLSGNKYGKLLVMDENFNQKNTSWNCLCDCGVVTIVSSDALKSNNTKSCGCLKIELLSVKSTKHGACRVGLVKKEYYIWRGMVDRCYRKSNFYYNKYGGRGIKICDRWRYDFSAFLEDMGEKPSDNYSIDRINNDGDYSPENCRWATTYEQSRNKSSNHWIEYNGNKKIISDWARFFNLNSSNVIRNMISRGKTFDEIYKYYTTRNDTRK